LVISVAGVPQYPLGDLPGHPLDGPSPGPFPEFSATDPALDDPDYYPTSDGRPMAETDVHRQEMVEAIDTLKMYFAGQQVYVSGNILLYYKPGNRRRHVSPDLLVVKGLSPELRDNYLVWKEGKAPDVVVEYTSKSTKEEDLDEKFEIYRDQIKVSEYFLFDPRDEYLDPALQGYRLIRSKYVPIKPVEGRLPSEQLGLHLERQGSTLRFYDPVAGQILPRLSEAHHRADAERKKADAERKKADAEREKAEMARSRAEAAENEERAARQKAEQEAERLRKELEDLRRRG
jgi:Uma2 family endonuclease